MFVWPYSHAPYSIQEDMMRAIGGALEEAKSGVFESPTGTGKSRSILCSVIPWLLSNLEKKQDADGVADEPSWITEYANEQSAQTLHRLDFLRKQRENRVKQLQQHSEKKARLVDDEEDDEEVREHRAEELEAFAPLRKVYFCSRTHTQLAQFSAELRKINAQLPRPVSCVILGSRTHLCVNEELKEKHSNASLNDACLDLNDTKAKCPFNNNSELVDWLADYALNTELPDLEDLTNKHTCAYYASRQAARSAQIILLPYSSILNQETRTALEIDLKGNVVVFDEAHNLVEAVADAHSTQITFSQLDVAIQDITNYVQKYERLNLDTKNLLLQLSTMIMPKLMLTLQCSEEVVWTVDQFLVQVKLQDFNFLPLLSKAKELKLNRKLKAVSTSQVTILSVLSFLGAVGNNFDTGRIKLTPKNGFRFFLLDIATKFTEIVQRAHSVLLCGGTMHPVEQVISQLFPQNKQDIVRFSCGHVIPKDNLQVLQVSTSPARPQTELLFTHGHDLFEDLNASIRNLCAVCPQGMVVFFPSYSMLEGFMAAAPRAYKKQLVVETRQGNENAFQLYEQLVNNNESLNGAMLFAVVGGRLSEGINFSDHLARCIVMVGLPFPNRNEVEMREKMLFHEQRFGRGAGNRYLENQCWKSVNQSIGRAIRHANDFALVVLLDVRFTASQDKLPAWIGTRFERCEGWGQVMRQTNLFFKPKFLNT